ncbi:Protein draper [Eumeta japonica]|uniref:Protein draper n=1 Tax=Eumeta variegata TaxID=151549 RepID=A0A4C1WGV2_EUMVA|nr:Protein draper [Eumeta japonica]
MQLSLVGLENRASRIQWMLWAMFVVLFLGHAQSLNGPNVCMVKQKYNITKRIKYRAPTSVRTYEWCFALPPRCSRWTTEMRDLTRLEVPLRFGSFFQCVGVPVVHSPFINPSIEILFLATQKSGKALTEERTAEVAVCCPGYKMKDITCIPVCPNGKTGPACSEDCPKNKWGPNCVNECKECSNNGTCSPDTGECQCQDGWKGESCQIRIATTTVEIPTDALITSETFATSTRALTSPIVVTPQSAEALTTPPVGRSTKLLATPFIKTEYFVPKVDAKSVPKYSTLRENTFTPTTENYSKMPSITFTSFNVKEPSASPTVSSEMAPYTVGTILGSIPKSTTERTSIFAKDNLTFGTTTVKRGIDIVEATKHKETTKFVEPITKITQFVNKAKPKEIWIKPAQKGDYPIIETKHKTSNETIQTKNRHVTKKLLTSANTTPKTIIVSIIPTSVAYSTYKKISLTTTAYQQAKDESNTSRKHKDSHFTISTNWSSKIYSQPTAPTAKPNFTLKILSADITKLGKLSTIINGSRSKLVPNATESSFFEFPKKNSTNTSTTSMYGYSTTNSMKNENLKPLLYSILTTKSSYSPSTNHFNFRNATKLSTSNLNITITNKMLDNKTLKVNTDFETTTKSLMKYFTTQKVDLKSTAKSEDEHLVKATKKLTSLKSLASTVPEYVNRTNKNGILTKLTTTTLSKRTNLVTSTEKAVAGEDETFDILTEPEHITAVMGDKERDKTSPDLLSVLSIAGGSMMAIITVAVVIVMIERCKKSRYDDMQKVNNIRMQVVMENNDVPPPYVRSIFHTPLPDPPISDKCHYQPISTLDRNLKQFMRPVVVQAISPVMFENFRGILECHYDHLPRRSNDFVDIQRHSIAPPLGSITEPLHGRCSRIDYTVSESTIEALKCEAKLNVIDSSTSEPLYAEIPSWRPPSEHAIEVLNVAGEAVTEL